MGGLLGISDEFKVFKCPFCRHYSSSTGKNCPKCSMEFTEEVRKTALRIENEEVKSAARKFYKPSIYAGVIFLAIGLLPAIIVIFRFGWSLDYWESLVQLMPYVVVGLVAIFYGWRGLRKNR